MKITKVEPVLCDAIWRVWIFIKVQTDEGLVGYGECGDNWARPHGVAGCVRDLEHILIDKDPRAVAKLYWDMENVIRQSPGGVAQKAVAGIETALWDIKAKALGVPLYDLFGGKIRHKVRLYWSHCGTYRAFYPDLLGTPPLRSMQDIFNLGKEVVDRGFTALKTNMIVPGNSSYIIRSPDGNSLDLDRDMIEAIKMLISTFRDAVGDKVDICLDLNFNFKTEGFVQIARALERYNLMWLEGDTYDPNALLQIKQSTKIPICSAENLCTSREYKPFFNLHSLDIAMVDVPWNGFTESRRIADLADIHDITITPHNHYSHLATFMSAHLCASTPNIRIMEVDVDSVPWRDDIFTKLPIIKDGYLVMPDKPGLGTDLNEKEIVKHLWDK
jgi:galactonate dehydratase